LISFQLQLRGLNHDPPYQIQRQLLDQLTTGNWMLYLNKMFLYFKLIQIESQLNSPVCFPNKNYDICLLLKMKLKICLNWIKTLFTHIFFWWIYPNYFIYGLSLLIIYSFLVTHYLLLRNLPSSNALCIQGTLSPSSLPILKLIQWKVQFLLLEKRDTENDRLLV
jgi:hypothetical protein